MKRVLLAVFLFLNLLSAANALGVLKVSVIPEKPVAGEEVRIVVRTAVTNEPVEGAKVYIRSNLFGKTFIGVTDSNGELKYVFEKPGVYTIIVEKTGYRSITDFTLNVAEFRKKIQETSEKLKEMVETSEELIGVTIKPSKYIKEVVREEVLKRLDEDKKKIVEQLSKTEIAELKQYILFSKDKRGIVLTKEDIPECYVKLRGIGLGIVDYRGYRWYIFYSTNFEVLDEKGVSVTTNQILSDVERYKFELLNVSTHYRAISVTYMYEEANIAVPVTVGFVSDREKTREEFVTNILKNAGKFNRSERLSREFVDNLLQSKSPKRIAVFRVMPSYWIDADAYVKGVLLSIDDANAYVSLLPEKLKDVTLPQNAKIVLLEIDRTIKGEVVTVEDIRKSPEKFVGKQVVVESVGVGVNISTNQVIEKALKLASKTAPALAPAAAAAEVNPVDILVQAEVRWYPAVPSNRYQVIPVVGVLSYSGEAKKTAVEQINELDKVSRIYGYVVWKKFGLDMPVIVVQDKKFVRTVSKGEIKEDIMNIVEDIKKKIESKVKEDVKAGSGVSPVEKSEEGQKVEETGTPAKETVSEIEKTTGFSILFGLAAIVLAMRLVKRN